MKYRTLLAISVLLVAVSTAQDEQGNETNTNTEEQATPSTEEEDKYKDYSVDCGKDADGNDVTDPSEIRACLKSPSK